MLKGKNLNLDINDADSGIIPANKNSIFYNKRYSQQPPPKTAAHAINSQSGHPNNNNPRAMFN